MQLKIISLYIVTVDCIGLIVIQYSNFSCFLLAYVKDDWETMCAVYGSHGGKRHHFMPNFSVLLTFLGEEVAC